MELRKERKSDWLFMVCWDSAKVSRGDVRKNRTCLPSMVTAVEEKVDLLVDKL